MLMKNAYWKDIIRTIGREKKRFFSIAVIAALGVTMMCGLRASCEDLRQSADRFFDEQHLFDIRILSTLGLTDADLVALGRMEEINLAEGGYNEVVYTVEEDVRKSIDLRSLSENKVNIPYVLEGRLPKKANEIAITKSYFLETGKSVGDVIKLQEKPELFVEESYVITGMIIDPLDVNSSEGSMGFRSTATTDYVGYVPETAADSDVYTAVYLRLEGTENLNCYSKEYESAVEQVVDEIESLIKIQREWQRYEEVYGEAKDQWLDGKAEMEAEFSKAEKEFSDAQQELDAAKQELEEGKRETAQGWNTIAAKKKELAEGKKEIEARKKEIEEGWKALEEGRKESAAGKAELDRLENSANETFSQAKKELETQEQALNAGYAQYESEKAAFEAKKATFLAQIAELDGALENPSLTDEERAGYESQKAQVQSLITQGEQKIAQTYAGLESGRQELEENKVELAAQEKHTYERIQEGRKAQENGEAEFLKSEKELQEGEKQLAAAEKQIQSGEAELALAEQKLASGQQGLVQGEKELQEGEKELKENLEKYKAEKEKAEKELADAKAEIDEIDRTKWYVQDRTTLSGYANVKSDANSIQAIGAVFPILFIIVAVLISLTTITRMVEEERGLIGTYKALGFSNTEIQRKYVFYAALACLLGGIVGDICGYVVLPGIIFIVFQVMYQFPEYGFQFDVLYGLGGILFFEIGVVGATLYSCRKALKRSPAELMRPKAPKAGSRVFLERIKFLWKRLSFLNKVTARNLFRYKKRMMMTIFGIAGCTGLLLCGFTIKDTVSEMMPQQYEVVYKYDLMAVTAAEDFVELEKILDSDREISDYLAVGMESADIFNEDGKKETLQLIVVPNGKSIEDYIHLKTKSGKNVNLENEDILLTRNATRTLNLSIGDEIRIQNLDLQEAETEITQIVENYFGNAIYLTEQKYEELFGEFETNGVFAKFSEKCEDEKAYTDELKREEIILSANCTQAMMDEFSSAFRLLNMVVAVILVLAALLAFVVLFTLSNTNISERERELATIKVLGFYHPEVHSYVNKETWILTAMGILLGMPLGWLLGRYVMGILKFSSLEFYITLYPQSYLYAAMITILFGIIVNFITNKVLDKINMVEALKSVE